jgi:hypothetical protein
VVVSNDHRGVSVLVKSSSAGSVEADKAIGGLQTQINALRNGLFEKAEHLEDVVLTTTAFARIKHGLGRPPKGYIVVRQKTAPGFAYSLYDDNDNRTDARDFLYLRSIGADVTLDLVVF